MDKDWEYLSPGTKVQYDGGQDGGPECGIVVHCWMNEEIHGYDCYVAFFGQAFPVGKPSCIPYVLRYASVSLDVIDG